MTKKTMITVAAVSVLSGGLVAATNAFAQTPANGQNGIPSLVQEIANKFHLNTGDVQSVFTQHRQEIMTQRETNYENYLQNLVDTGKITDTQKQLILTKHKELVSQMQSNLKNFKNMTPAERKAQMQSTMQDLQTWAKQNNIPLQYLRPFGPGMGRFGKYGWHKPMPTPTP
jgi:Skp family chaperone for outer membrane proteins